MTDINLLPWREQLREDRKKEFLVSLGGVVVIAVGLLFLMDRFVNGAIEDQNERNNYLITQIEVLDGMISEIRELRSQKAELTERMAVIQDLQGTRPVIVRLFDELVRTLPDGVFYNSITRTDDTINLEGIAESNNKISTLMRELDNSDWFANPNFRQVTATDDEEGAVGSGLNNLFLLSVSVTRPDQEGGRN